MARSLLFRKLPLCCIAACAVCGGCTRKSDLPLAQVTGRVTFYGRPVRAEVFFQPEATGRPAGGGRPSTAISDEQGEFKLAFTRDESGAIVGRHHVLIKILPYSDVGPAPNFKLGTQTLKDTHLARVVGPGKNRFDFAVTY